MEAAAIATRGEVRTSSMWWVVLAGDGNRGRLRRCMWQVHVANGATRGIWLRGLANTSTCYSAPRRSGIGRRLGPADLNGREQPRKPALDCGNRKGEAQWRTMAVLNQ
jgi:hypothetical protein